MMGIMAGRPGRNEPCHCGSGRKYKQCCLDKDEARIRAALAKAAAATPEPPPDAPKTPPRAPKHTTQQPWKTVSTHPVHSRVRTPRKVGGS